MIEQCSSLAGKKEASLHPCRKPAQIFAETGFSKPIPLCSVHYRLWQDLITGELLHRVYNQEVARTVKRKKITEQRNKLIEMRKMKNGSIKREPER